MSETKREIFIRSILGVEQREDSMLFEMSLVDCNGKEYRSRFFVRDHNIGLFNLALKKINPIRDDSFGKTAIRTSGG